MLVWECGPIESSEVFPGPGLGWAWALLLSKKSTVQLPSIREFSSLISKTEVRVRPARTTSLGCREVEWGQFASGCFVLWTEPRAGSALQKQPWQRPLQSGRTYALRLAHPEF